MPSSVGPLRASQVHMGDWKTELTGRVLVLVAHADDESVGYGALLQRMQEAVVVIATDGAPRDRYFWEGFGSREAYAAVRRDEARRALRLAGVRELVLLAEVDSRLEDQRLFLNLMAAYGLLEKLVERVKPAAIATLAYEGGHPDHDSCSLLGALLGEQFGVPVWEAPLYSRANGRTLDDLTASASPTIADSEWANREVLTDPHLPTAGRYGAPLRHAVGDKSASSELANMGEMRLQQFICQMGDEVAVEMDAGELEQKRTMCAQYVSQGDFLHTFEAQREVVRPQVKYDYGRAPHEGLTNYEHWQWWMSAQDVSARFSEFLETRS